MKILDGLKNKRINKDTKVIQRARELSLVVFHANQHVGISCSLTLTRIQVVMDASF